ncbi:hypothetical protein [Vulcanisaeta sp. JCM 16159]|uniref:hypothetical protein n=1 Tax=Vulcanisaeta sp. JCM 16159 TaxID=1295371 RepID=UPI0006D00910|nr:hypothetical protein [Vulcanisaeta sp. JCM 16159]
MSQQASQDPIKDAADAIRIVIHREQAYDILDELSSNPKLETLVNALSKISRLATKTLNDLKGLKDELSNDKECEDRINKIIQYKLQWWSKKQDEFYNYIKNVNDVRTEIKRFAAYALAPDPDVVEIEECEDKAKRGSTR